jgi:hypothetical protein
MRGASTLGGQLNTSTKQLTLALDVQEALHQRSKICLALECPCPSSKCLADDRSIPMIGHIEFSGLDLNNALRPERQHLLEKSLVLSRAEKVDLLVVDNPLSQRTAPLCVMSVSPSTARTLRFNDALRSFCFFLSMKDSCRLRASALRHNLNDMRNVKNA